MLGWLARCRRVVVVALAAAAPLVAEEPPAAEKTPDYSDGFRRLIALGLPAMDATARWVRQPAAGNQMSYYYRQAMAKMKGNAWVIAGDGDQKQFLPPGGLEPIPGGSAAPPAKNDADLAKDVEALIEILTDNEDLADDLLRSGGFSSSSFEGANSGNLLVFATQIHQAGHDELANRLAHAVFTRSGSAERIIDSAISQLASIEYMKCVSRFFEDPDFAALHDSLVGLQERFPRGWSDAPAVAMLMPQLKRQSTGETPPAPRLEGVDLDPEVVAAIAAWQEAAPKSGGSRRPAMPEYGFMHDGMNFPELWLLAGNEGEDAPQQGPHAELVKHGMQALPVLIALLDDPWLTVHRNLGSGSHYYSSSESEEQRIIRAYRTMFRPATRGEIARQLLAATLPDPGDDLDEAETDTIRMMAMDFWKEHRGKSREELLLVFMQQGSQEQSTTVALQLATSTDPAAHAAFEKHVLASENPTLFFSHVGVYLRARRAAGKQFLDAYAAKVREFVKLSNDENETSWEIRQAGGIDKALKSLEALASPESPRTIARKIARGEPDEAEAAIRSLLTLIEDSEPARQLEVLIDGASMTTNTDIRCQFLAATFRIDWTETYENDEEDDEKEPTPRPPRELSGTETIVWRKLMADTRPIPDKMSGNFNLLADSTVGGLATTALEFSAAPDEVFKLRQLEPTLDKALGEYLTDRARARIAGDPVPPVPDASRVSAERLRAMVAEASALSAADVRGFFGKLSPDERVKWIEWFAEPEDPPLPPDFMKSSNHVVARMTRPFYGVKDMPGVQGLEPGFVVTPENVEKHVAKLAGEIAAHSPGMMFMQMSPISPGLEVCAFKAEPPAQKADGDNDETPPMSREQQILQSVFQGHASTFAEHADLQGIIVASAGSGQQGKTSTWWIRDGKLVRPEGARETNQWGVEEDPEGFKEILETSLKSLEDRRFYLRIDCLAREHAEQFNPNQE